MTILKGIKAFSALLKALSAQMMVLILFVALTISQIAESRAGSLSDSCLEEDSLILQIKNYVGSLGTWPAIASGFTMKSNTKAEGEHPTGSCPTATNPNAPVPKFSDGTIFDCAVSSTTDLSTVKRCSTPTDKIKFCYAASIFGWQPFGESCHTFKDGDDKYVQGAWFRAVTSADTICVQVLLLTGWTNIGCKYRPYTPININMTAGCYAAQSCSTRGTNNSKSIFPISSVVMQCVKESIAKIFVDPNSCSDGSGVNSRSNMFPAFQSSMRKAVMAFLTLYVIIFGMKIALGQQLPRKSEVFTFIIKMVLVTYFSVGIYTGNQQGTNQGYENGLTGFLIPAFFGAGNALANLVFQASSSGLCQYQPETYPPGYDYLALWDSLDCRIAFYLGLNTSSTVNVFGGAVQIPMLFQLLVPSIFSFQIIFFFFCCCFVVFLISYSVFFIHSYIISLLALSIIAYMGPLFVPMALFRVTKQYFDSWVRMLISFAFQPMVISAFLALLLTIFDQAFYGTCSWSCGLYDSANSGQCILWKMNSSTDRSCTESFGYHLYNLNLKDNLTNFPAIFFDVTILNVGLVNAMMKGMGTVLLFAFLFYHFSQLASDFAADLTGGPSLGSLSVNPNAVLHVVGDVIKKVVDKKTGGAISKMEKMRAAARGDAAGAAGEDAMRRSGLGSGARPAPAPAPKSGT
jgi:type IV secretion system protein VirB6